MSPIAHPLFGRRDLLKGLGAGSLLLAPFMRSLEAAAQGAAPRRIILLCLPNGRDKSTWYGARRSETDWDLGPNHSTVLASVKKDMVMIRGNYMDIGDHRGDGHFHGNVFAYTGWRTIGGTQYAQLPGGPSLDFAIHQAISPTKKILPIAINGENTWRIAWAAKETKAVLLRSPAETFNTLFGGAMTPAPAMAPAMADNSVALRSLLLDRSRADVNALRTRLAGTERELLDVHIGTIDQALRTIDPDSKDSSPAQQCNTPRNPGNVTDNYREWKEQIRLVADAFACDRSRVASIQFAWYTHNHEGNVGNFAADSHSYSHWYEKSGQENQLFNEKRRMMDRQWATYVVELIEELKLRKEGNGSVFDNTAIVFYSEISDGHDFTDMPCMIFGSLGGRLNTGRFLDLRSTNGGRSPAGSQNNLLVALAQGMGWNISTFGDPNYCSGPTPGLLKA